MHDAHLPVTLGGKRLEKYFHTCAFFSSQDEEYRVLSPFIAEGLDASEMALHITDPRLRDEHLRRLEAAGIEVETHQREGRLDVLTWQETYVKDGRFDQQRMLDAIDGTIRNGKERGFPRTRIVGHMEWGREAYPGVEDMLEYEVRVNDVLAQTRQPAVCVYDLNRLTGAMMMDILRAHPMTIIDGTLHENPFFTQPEQMLKELRTRPSAPRGRQ